MALKKSDNQGITIDPAAMTPTPEDTTPNTPETPPETPAEPTSSIQTPDPEVIIPEIPSTPPIEVNPTPAPETNIPKVEPQVRIRMARDHRCNIGMKLYDLKKGQCYNVPSNVKRVLNNAGLLSPL